MTDFTRLWMFNCGSPTSYVIDAGENGDERKAMEIATAYAKERGIRPPATVRPLIVAGPEILGPTVAADVTPSTPASTQTLGEKIVAGAKELIGR